MPTTCQGAAGAHVVAAAREGTGAACAPPTPFDLEGFLAAEEDDTP